MNEVEAEGKIAQEDKTVSVSKESKTEKVEEDGEKVRPLCCDIGYPAPHD